LHFKNQKRECSDGGLGIPSSKGGWRMICLSIPFKFDNKNKVFYLSCQAKFFVEKEIIATI